MGKFLLVLILGAVGFLSAIYFSGIDLLPPADPPTPGLPFSPSASKIDVSKFGDDLYPPAAFPPLAVASDAKLFADPVVISGHLSSLEQQDVPSQLSGQILFIGDAVPEGAVQLCGVAPFMAEPYYYASVQPGATPMHTFYRRLYEGQIIRADQMVGMIDPTKALGYLEEKQRKLQVAIAEERAGKAGAQEGDTRYARAKELHARGALGAEELGQAFYTMVKLKEEHIAKIAGVELGKIEIQQAEINLRQHEIRNKLPYKKAIIKSILKSRGYAVKELDTVMTLHSIDRLLAESLIEIQYAERLRKHMNQHMNREGRVTATIEPTHEEAPDRMLRGHRDEVTCVAVSRDRDQPRIVSGSLDQTVCVWTRASQGPVRVLLHPSGVNSVACAPASAEKNTCVVGCADGSIALWDLDREIEARRIPDAHAEAVTCLAFSPDGRFIASGSAQGGIAIWTASGERLYSLDGSSVDAPHHGAITALTFLPQGQLVSASRDNTLRVWQLREKGAVPYSRPITGRDGKVTQLGVSPDGKWMLFDKGFTLHLISVEKGHTLNTLQGPGASTPFETCAVVSPDGSLILTAGAPEGRMQLWQAPTELSRGFEVRQLVSAEHNPMTCAAFSPAAGQGGPDSFIVSASGSTVYLWPVPSAQEVRAHRIENVPLTLISQSQDVTSHQLRIGFEVTNPVSPQYPNGRLVPGRPVTIVIE